MKNITFYKTIAFEQDQERYFELSPDQEKWAGFVIKELEKTGIEIEGRLVSIEEQSGEVVATVALSPDALPPEAIVKVSIGIGQLVKGEALNATQTFQEVSDAFQSEIVSKYLYKQSEKKESEGKWPAAVIYYKALTLLKPRDLMVSHSLVLALKRVGGEVNYQKVVQECTRAVPDLNNPLNELQKILVFQKIQMLALHGADSYPEDGVKYVLLGLNTLLRDPIAVIPNSQEIMLNLLDQIMRLNLSRLYHSEHQEGIVYGMWTLTEFSLQQIDEDAHRVMFEYWLEMLLRHLVYHPPQNQEQLDGLIHIVESVHKHLPLPKEICNPFFVMVSRYVESKKAFEIVDQVFNACDKDVKKNEELAMTHACIKAAKQKQFDPSDFSHWLTNDNPINDYNFGMVCLSHKDILHAKEAFQDGMKHSGSTAEDVKDLCSFELIRLELLQGKRLDESMMSWMEDLNIRKPDQERIKVAYQYVQDLACQKHITDKQRGIYLQGIAFKGIQLTFQTIPIDQLTPYWFEATHQQGKSKVGVETHQGKHVMGVWPGYTAKKGSMFRGDWVSPKNLVFLKKCWETFNPEQHTEVSGYWHIRTNDTVDSNATLKTVTIQWARRKEGGRNEFWIHAYPSEPRSSYDASLKHGV